MTLLYQELPYRPDSAELFSLLADEPWAMFFDSGRPFAQQGRYDILCADPMAVIESRHGTTWTRTRHAPPVRVADPLAEIRRWLAAVESHELPGPFAGGAAGYFGYDFGGRLEGLPVPDQSLPELALGFYDWAVVVDHHAQCCWMAGLGRDPRTRERWNERVQRFRTPTDRSPASFRPIGPVSSNLERDAYARAFARVQHYIHEGDCYQVNLARRFVVAVEGSPWDAYRRLRAINRAPYGAYLNFPDHQVLSASPEQFLSLKNGTVVTRPIKGTRPRAANPAEDRALAEALRASSKDRAENVMIVDLLRNDLGKSCATGSVSVPELFKVESFATVHHLVSTVCGQLAPGRDGLDLLAGCLPGGSITGAPKRRAMEIIEELEPNRREVYCGTIGYFGADGNMDTNIAIRTLVHSHGQMRFWAGGGIVADSIMEQEFQETEHKAAGLRRLFER